MTTLYGLKTCDTCKKAMKVLDAGGVAYRFVDIRAEADLKSLAPRWIAAVGAAPLVNTRSTTWRGLSETDRARAETDPAGLLSENPTLVKRPVIETGGKVLVGWTKHTQTALGV